MSAGARDGSSRQNVGTGAPRACQERQIRGPVRLVEEQGDLHHRSHRQRADGALLPARQPGSEANRALLQYAERKLITARSAWYMRPSQTASTRLRRQRKSRTCAPSSVRRPRASFFGTAS